VKKGRVKQTADAIQLVPRENGEDEGRRRGAFGDDAQQRPRFAGSKAGRLTYSASKPASPKNAGQTPNAERRTVLIDNVVIPI